jgi:hypothetical protein
VLLYDVYGKPQKLHSTSRAKVSVTQLASTRDLRLGSDDVDLLKSGP